MLPIKSDCAVKVIALLQKRRVVLASLTGRGIVYLVRVQSLRVFADPPRPLHDM